MEGRRSTSLMLLLLYALLILALLIWVVSGARLYTNALEMKELHSEQRGALAFVQSQVAANGGAGNISIRETTNGTMLCLKEQETAYETRIYASEGWLYAEFTKTDAETQPDRAVQICAVSGFAVSWQTDRLLRITADGRTAYACSDGGGGNAE